MKVTDEMAAAGASVKNVDTSSERDKKGDDSLHVERVEAAAKAIYEVSPNGGIKWDSAEFDEWMERGDYLTKARAALEAADAVVTEEMIAETILKALVFTNENSGAWADGLARDIAALFRGGAK